MRAPSMQVDSVPTLLGARSFAEHWSSDTVSSSQRLAERDDAPFSAATSVGARCASETMYSFHRRVRGGVAKGVCCWAVGLLLFGRGLVAFWQLFGCFLVVFWLFSGLVLVLFWLMFG